MKNNYKILGLVFIFWLFVGCIFLVSYILDAQQYDPEYKINISIVLATLTIYSSWFLLTCILYILLKRPIQTGKIFRSFIILLIALILSIPVLTYLDQNATAIFAGQDTLSFIDTLKKTPYGYMFFNFLLFLLVSIMCICVIYQQYSKNIQLSASELKREKSETQLKLVSLRMQTLQSQLSPHFLFNCLSAISALSRDKSSEIVTDAITQLGDLLRYAISSSKKSVVSLDKEQAFITNYIYFQHLRFNDRIEFRLNLLKNTTKFVCPPFISQTLIENAITHGMSSESSMHISIDVSHTEEYLSFNVKNSKCKFKKNNNRKGIGIGIKNLEQRLKIIYGNDYSINNSHNQYEYISNVIIPLKEPLE